MTIEPSKSVKSRQ